MPITVSTPGKLMLFGEHAVMYGKPCLVTTVSPQLVLRVEKFKKAVFCLEAADIGVKQYKKRLRELGWGNIPEKVKLVERAVSNFFGICGIKKGVKIEIVSDFSPKLGLGSSSAVVVGVIKALAELFEIDWSERQLFDFAYEVILSVQGKGSGFDIAAAVYGGTLYFVKGGKLIESLKIKDLPLVVGYSGKKAPTVSLIKRVAARKEKYPDLFELIFTEIEKIVEQAKIAIEERNWHLLGDLMDFNQGFLEILGVSSGRLSTLIYAAREAGAYGAKLSGAGGGDCMIALVSERKKTSVKEAIETAGGKVISVETGVSGAGVI